MTPFCVSFSSVSSVIAFPSAGSVGGTGFGSGVCALPSREIRRVAVFRNRRPAFATNGAPSHDDFDTLTEAVGDSHVVTLEYSSAESAAESGPSEDDTESGPVSFPFEQAKNEPAASSFTNPSNLTTSSSTTSSSTISTSTPSALSEASLLFMSSRADGPDSAFSSLAAEVVDRAVQNRELQERTRLEEDVPSSSGGASSATHVTPGLAPKLAGPWEVTAEQELWGSRGASTVLRDSRPTTFPTTPEKGEADRPRSVIGSSDEVYHTVPEAGPGAASVGGSPGEYHTVSEAGSAQESDSQEIASGASFIAEAVAAITLFQGGSTSADGVVSTREDQATTDGRRRKHEAMFEDGTDNRKVANAKEVQSRNGALLERAAAGGDPAIGGGVDESQGKPVGFPKKVLKWSRRRALFTRVGRDSTMRRVLGIPAPGEQKKRQIKKRTAAVREQMSNAVRSAQQSAIADIISSVFYIVFPLSIGAVVYTAVGHLIGRLDPQPPPPPTEVHTWWNKLSDTWQHWMMSGQAAGAAGAFAGFAGVGIAAKTAAPAAALMTSSVGELDTLWRSFGGASLVALYWKTLVFGKTFRAIEWRLTTQESPEGAMHSLTIRVPSLCAMKAKIAAENGLDDPSEIQQLALWVPGSGDFVEPLRQPKDISLVPELGYIIWTTTPEEEMSFPNRAYRPKSAKAVAEPDPTVAEGVAIISSIKLAWVNSVPGPTGSCVEECSPETVCDLWSARDWAPMTEEERDALILLVAREDRGLRILFHAFGDSPSFIHHALHYLRSAHC